MFIKFILVLILSSFTSALSDLKLILEKQVYDFELEAYQHIEEEFYRFVNTRDPGAVRALHVERILKFVNKDVDPCDNFYEFACGNYPSYINGTNLKNELTYSPGAVNVRVLEKVLSAKEKSEDVPEELQAFFDTCVEQHPYKNSSVSIFKTTFIGYGGKKRFNWVVADYSLANLGLSVILGLLIDGRGAINVQLVPRSRSSEYSSQETFTAFAGDLLKQHYRVSDEFIGELTDGLYDFETVLVDAVEAVDKNDVQTVKIEQFLDIFPSVKADPNLQSFLEKLAGFDVKLVGGSRMIELIQHLEDTSPTILHNYFLWDVLKEFSDLLKAFEGFSPGEVRHACAALSATLMTNEATYVFAKELNYDPAAKVDVTNIMENIKKQLRKRFESNEWFDEPTRNEILKKVQEHQELLFGPDDVFLTKSEPPPMSIVKSPTQGFVAKLYSLRMRKQFNIQNNFLSAERMVDAWTRATPTEPYATDIREIGVLSVLIGMLTHPFYRQEYPNFFKYGKAGGVIGHEYMHSFDDEGIKLDSTFKTSGYMSQNVTEKLTESFECFLKEYIRDNEVDARKTLSENLADVVGIDMAFNAYRSWIETTGTADDVEMEGYSVLGLDKYQAFFLSYAQTFCTAPDAPPVDDFHIPDQLRSRIVLANTPYFSEAYHCPAGSKMNPEVKCKYL